MTSIEALIFLALQDRIKNNSTVTHIAEDTGQLMDEQPAISYPCVLIGMERADFTDMSQNCQIGTINITVKIITAPHSSDAGNTPIASRKKALSYYDIENDVHKLLQGWAPAYVDEVDGPDLLGDVCGRLDRMNARTINNISNLRIREVRYTLGIDDYQTKLIQDWSPKPDTLELDVHFEDLPL